MIALRLQTGFAGCFDDDAVSWNFLKTHTMCSLGFQKIPGIGYKNFSKSCAF
jgi:hypothetical protein